ncbi:RHS repeat-associated core domain-containing protein [Pseudomonas sp. 681]|uniref:RHS repeat-associated core domain-containing protein n=1 Tax=Pseudomonas fungipugnans TaxID=3024217 RepID=A0ABT6QX26_9PSED|nr:RHS repeat-associated core domain-containing protein [Pseudomonas sp. 681]MDI2595465.1 RHS repeat-associated core domain-containing protein [Pseudomonas sp. 681]
MLFLARVRYQYDALDRLVSHGRLDDAGRQRFYCDNRLVTELEGDERLSIVQHADQLLAQQQCHGDGVISTLLATDQQRSVLNELQANSQRSIAYSSYGHHPRESGLSSLLGFNGQRAEPVTGHYLLGNGYRAFNPVLMRFNSPDNLSPFDKGGLNAYGYCQGDPVNRIDPTGHMVSAIANFFSKVKARYLAVKYGTEYKPVKYFTKISEESAVFVDQYKDGSRLNVYAHGPSSGGLLWDSKTLLGPGELAQRLKNTGLHFESFDSARLIMCHSASEPVHPLNTSGGSFAELFSDFSGLSVKAYEGRVIAENLMPRIKQLKVGETSSRTEYFGISKKGKSLRQFESIGAQYKPVTFQPPKVRNV